MYRGCESSWGHIGPFRGDYGTGRLTTERAQNQLNGIAYKLTGLNTLVHRTKHTDRAYTLDDRKWQLPPYLTFHLVFSLHS
jgi:hypothetical protein